MYHGNNIVGALHVNFFKPYDPNISIKIEDLKRLLICEAVVMSF